MRKKEEKWDIRSDKLQKKRDFRHTRCVIMKRKGCWKSGGMKTATAFVRKNGSGLRVFADSDIGWLEMIECLKGVGMPLKGIKQYIDWYREGDTTLPERLEMFKRQKQNLEQQMAMLNKHMEKINYKINLYTEAVKLGSLEQAMNNKKIREEKKKVYDAA